MPTDLAALDAAIHSIFAFIQRTAEPAEHGTTWETIDYENKPHHSIGVFNGVGGIPFFLTEYHRRHGTPAALTLARDAVDWCANFTGEHFRRGLHFGETGVALAALRVAAAAGEKAAPEFSIANARFIMSEPPGPVTDLIGGAASNGLYLLKLHEHTCDDEWLRGAERCAAWLEGEMVRDERGTHCHMSREYREKNPERIFLGVAHGISGVAHFLACLAERTRSERWAGLARELFSTVMRHAQPARGGVNWNPAIDGKGPERCQWSHGAAGIGLTLLTAHRVLGDAEYLDLAVQAAEATFNYGDFRHNYTQCTGLAGGGELLLEMHHATGDAKWRERALDFAHQSLGYREDTPEGDAWPTDAPGLYSADFLYGASGLGHFLLRATAHDPAPMPLM